MAEDPGKASLGDLVKAIHCGKYVIPYFQRGYEWEPSMVSDLFESILQDYYAGLLLFWELDAERVKKQVWDPVWGAEDSENPSWAILDGQQRLASLYYAIYNPGQKFPQRRTYYRWFLNLDACLNKEFDGTVDYRYSFQHHSTAELKSRKEEWVERGVMPLAILSDAQYLTSQEFAQWLEHYVSSRHRRNLIPPGISALRVSNLIQSIRNYQFVTTILSKDRDIHDICNIFARINQKGMRLSTFDLINAFLYPQKIQLRKQWEALNNEKLKEVDRNMHEYLLKLISLHVQSYCSSKYIYNLIPGEKTKKRTASRGIEEVVLVESPDQFSALWERACHYAEKAREIIMNAGKHDFGAIKSKFIPNTTLVPVLGAVLWECEKHAEQTGFAQALSNWYWCATLSGDYSGSSDTIMSKDFRDWQRWFAKGVQVDRAARVAEDFVESELDLRATARGSQYNAILCMLALNGARDFFTGRPLAMGDYIEERINDHHIFPAKVKGLDPAISGDFRACRDSILNRTLLLDETNKNKIRDKRPSVYLKELLHEGNIAEGELRELMQAHFISSPALDCLFRDDFDGLIREREKTLKAHILTLIT